MGGELQTASSQTLTKSGDFLIVKNGITKSAIKEGTEITISLTGLIRPIYYDKYTITVRLKVKNTEGNYIISDRLFYALTLKEASKKLVITTTDTSKEKTEKNKEDKVLITGETLFQSTINFTYEVQFHVHNSFGIKLEIPKRF